MELSAGSIRFDGVELSTLSASAFKTHANAHAVYFSGPLRQPLAARRSGILTEGLKIQRIGTGEERLGRACSALAQVELPADAIIRYAHKFSGGQRQRIGIARALKASVDDCAKMPISTPSRSTPHARAAVGDSSTDPNVRRDRQILRGEHTEPNLPSGCLPHARSACIGRLQEDGPGVETGRARSFQRPAFAII